MVVDDVPQRRRHQRSSFQWLTFLHFVVAGVAVLFFQSQPASSFSTTTSASSSQTITRSGPSAFVLAPRSCRHASAVTTHCDRRCCRRRSPFDALMLDSTVQGGGSFGDDNEENSRKLHSESNNIFYNDFEDTELSSRYPCLEESPPNTLTTKMPSSSTSTSSSTTTTTTSSSDDDDTSFFSSLLQRQTQLQQSACELHHQWTTGSAKSYAAFSINESYYYVSDGSSSPREKEEELLPFDWVRRVSIGSYPIVACGSAYGNIYVTTVAWSCSGGTLSILTTPGR